MANNDDIHICFVRHFFRNAFGNYGDILREIAYSPLMAENLSYLQSKSAAYMWETQQRVSFADENFAREIMQLFSTGLYLLNIDGTPKLDQNKNPILVYTNDEIMSFARIWTGFDYQQARGNVEEASRSGNRHDPMRVQASWRDKFPKSDLLGGYIGDGVSNLIKLHLFFLACEFTNISSSILFVLTFHPKCSFEEEPVTACLGRQVCPSLLRMILLTKWTRVFENSFLIPPQIS